MRKIQRINQSLSKSTTNYQVLHQFNQNSVKRRQNSIKHLDSHCSERSKI